MRLKSLYTRSFKPFNIQNQNGYYDNLKYRTERSLKERQHAPFDWPGESSESDSSSSDNEEEQCSCELPDSFNAGVSDKNQSAEDCTEDICLNVSNTGQNPSSYTNIRNGSMESKNKSQNCSISDDIKVRPKKLDRVIANKKQFETAQQILSSDTENVGVNPQIKEKLSDYFRIPALKALENYKNELPKHRIKKPKASSPLSSRSTKTVTQRYGLVQAIPVAGSKHPSVEWSVNGHRHQHTTCHKEPIDNWKSEYSLQYPNYPTTVYTRSISNLANFPRPFSTQANIGNCGPLKPRHRPFQIDTNASQN